METEEQIIENRIRTLANDPQYFGGYLNMARHNIYLIINNLTKTFSYLNFKEIADDAEIASDTHILSNIFDTSNSIIDEERIKVYNYLIKRHYLPFLKIFNAENIIEIGNEYTIDFKRLHNFIIKSFKKITDLRNAYSHYLSIDDDGNIANSNKKELDSSIKGDIDLLFKYAPQYSYIRNNQTQTGTDYTHLENYLLFEISENNTLTDQGLYFFINLFLTREHATKFLKRFKGFKNETTPPFRATIQAFTSYALKLPDERLGNENPIHSLLMEILAELNKCPKELFIHLTDEWKKEFEPVLSENGRKNIVLNSINYNELNNEDIEEVTKELSTLKRYDDRYPYFALRYLEDTNCLKRIRFQITLGKLIVNRYDKKIIGINQDRRVLKTVNTFGKLSDFVDKESDVLEILKHHVINTENIVFEQYAPHYNTNNNKIAFYIFDEEDEKMRR